MYCEPDDLIPGVISHSVTVLATKLASDSRDSGFGYLDGKHTSFSRAHEGKVMPALS